MQCSAPSTNVLSFQLLGYQSKSIRHDTLEQSIGIGNTSRTRHVFQTELYFHKPFILAPNDPSHHWHHVLYSDNSIFVCLVLGIKRGRERERKKERERKIMMSMDGRKMGYMWDRYEERHIQKYNSSSCGINSNSNSNSPERGKRTQSMHPFHHPINSVYVRLKINDGNSRIPAPVRSELDSVRMIGRCIYFDIIHKTNVLRYIHVHANEMTTDFSLSFFSYVCMCMYIKIQIQIQIQIQKQIQI